MCFAHTTPEKCLNTTVTRQFRFVSSKAWAGSLGSNRLCTKVELFPILRPIFSLTRGQKALYTGMRDTLGTAREVT